MGDIDAVQELSKFISNLKQQISKMHVKAQVLCLVALLFAVSNARYIGPGASGQCNGVQFFPKSSPDQFIMNMMQCNRIIQSGYPYQSKGQCMSNADRWISCMQTTLENCMSSNCPSMLGNMLGGMNFMPVFDSFQGVNSLEQVYQTLDGVIDQIFTLFNINLPGQLEMIKQSGIKNWPVPLPGVNGLTIDQLLTDLICPDPGVMPDSIQNILSSVESNWQSLSVMGYPDTSAYVPFCDGDFTQYIVNNLLEHAKAFFTATSRSEWCSVQTSLYEMGSNVLNNKCNFDRLATIFSQVGVPDALIAMFKDSPQLILYTSGCADTYQKSTYHSQPQYPSNNQQSSYLSQYSSNNQKYQSGGYQSNYQSPYAAGNNYNDLENLLQGLLGNSGFGNILQGLFKGSNMFGNSCRGSNLFGNSFGGLFGNSFLNPFGNLFESPYGNLFGGLSLNPFGNSFPNLFGNPFQNLFGGSYQSNYQPGYQSQYSSNYQQYPSSGYQQSNYQNQYAPANNYNNIGSLFQNLLGNIDFESIFQGLFGGSNMAGGSFQDIFGSLLQSFMGGSYPSGYQGSSSNYGSQSSGNQGSSSNYGSQSSGYQAPSGYPCGKWKLFREFFLEISQNLRPRY